MCVRKVGYDLRHAVRERLVSLRNSSGGTANDLDLEYVSFPSIVQ